MREKLRFITFRKQMMLSGIYFLIMKVLLTETMVKRENYPSLIFTNFYTYIYIGVKNNIASLNLLHNYIPRYKTIFYKPPCLEERTLLSE